MVSEGDLDGPPGFCGCEKRYPERKLNIARAPGLAELVYTRKWKEATEFIQTDKLSVYATTIDTHNSRLLFHDLCKLVSNPVTPDDDDDELSDDEDEQATEGEETPNCGDCEKEDNRNICELIKLMIDVSQSLGPVRVDLPFGETGEASGGEDEDDSFQVRESVLTVTDSLVKTPLHIVCENYASTRVIQIILESTREKTYNPCAPTTLELICAKDSRGSTPLHYLAYSRQCPFSSLRLLMDYSKPSVDEVTGTTIDPSLCTDLDGETPLHWAMDGYMSPRRIGQLTRHSKAALMLKNLSGRSPCDQFVENFVDVDWKDHDLCAKEVWQNIQAYLKVLIEDDEKEEEWLPVHMLAGSSINFPKVFPDIALHFNKEDLSKANSKGMLPLHLACSRTSGTSDVPCDGSLALKMLSSYPQAAYKAGGLGKKGRLPMHMAVASRKPLPLIANLLKAYPNSLNVKDPETGLWPFLLASVDNDQSVETSYSMLRADPSIVQLAVKSSPTRRSHRSNGGVSYRSEAIPEDQSSRRVRKAFGPS